MNRSVKRKRLFFTTIIFFLVLLVFSGCTKNKIQTGEWEGYYLYIGNTRMRTDGTNKEEILSSFTDKDGAVYALNHDSIYRTRFYDKYMFMHVAYPRGDERKLTGYALVVYDMQNKTSFLGASTGPYQEKCRNIFFYRAFDNYFVVQRQHPDGINDRYDFTTIDYNGNVIEEDDRFFVDAQIIGNDVFKFSNGYLTYSTVDDRTEKTLFRCPKSNVISTEYEHVYICDDNIFNPLTQEVNPIEYSPRGRFYGNDFIISKNEGEKTMSGFELWHINEDCSCEMVFSLQKRYNLKNNSFSVDKRYIRFVRCTTIFGNEYNTKYTCNRETKKVYEGNDSYCKDIGDVYGCTNGIKCGNYYYNIYYTPSLIFGCHPYSFYRYNSESQVTESLNVSELSGNGDASSFFQSCTVREY